ncbi:uncharacterized protein LOC128192789 [Crassostrea angulata]|uniref:uncharacterized protein LOC128192789 n=1 Tax=Magallana angulata TaxID=2784310 RepID=UPI0022B0E0E0|nr:uncharacterized protein LOC128192789 [Crassostrea angulata]
MCEESDTRDGVICCYNYYHNGSACVRCLPGYYSNDCKRECQYPSYGYQCYKKCECVVKSCHHVIGCLADYRQSSQFPTESPETFSTQHVQIYHKTHLLGNLSSSTEKLQYRSYSITNTKTFRILNSFTTDSNIIDASMPAPKSILFDTNIILITIGGVIALLLSILVVQQCLKFRLKRRKYAQQMSLKRSSIKEEERYHEINESLMTVGQYDNRNDPQELGKYYELQISDQASAAPYEKMETELQYQEINESSVLSSTSSVSCYGNTSYPVPDKRCIFVNVLDSSPAKFKTSSEESHVNLTNGSSKKDKSESSEYLDPIFDAQIYENTSKGCDTGTNNDTYLDVTHESVL